MKLRALWQRITTSRYTRALETEVLLLRAENRALLNSILGIAGVPPIPVPDATAVADNRAATTARAGARSLQLRARRAVPLQTPDDAADSTSAARSSDGAPSIAVPMRRRSWQQINRMLEFESARKKREA